MTAIIPTDVSFDTIEKWLPAEAIYNIERNFCFLYVNHKASRQDASNSYDDIVTTCNDL